MASGILVILGLLIAALSPNAQALVAEDLLEEDVAIDLQRGDQPWLALVALPGGVPCSASIVSPTSLLSAAVCLKGATNLTHGVAYAGNVEYSVPEDFRPPTQNRSVVDCLLYNQNSTLEYNIMLVKIAPKWIWSRSVQPVGVIDMERLPENFMVSCFVSGLGGGSGQVARAANVWMEGCAPSPQPLDLRMCSPDSGELAARAGDVGGPVLCEHEPEYKLYGIISEQSQSISERPSRVSGFQFVGFYMSWINMTAGDLPSDSEIKSLRMQQADGGGQLPLERLKRGKGGPNDEGSSTTVAPPPGGPPESGGGSGDGSEGPASEGAGGGGNGTAASGAGRACSGSCALPLLAALLALAVRALY